MTCASCARRCECRLFHGVASLSLSFEQFPSTFSDALSVEEMGFLWGKNTGDQSRAAEKSILFRLRNREILGQPEISISCVKHLTMATPLIPANLTNELRPASRIQDVSGLLSIAVLDSMISALDLYLRWPSCALSRSSCRAELASELPTI